MRNHRYLPVTSALSPAVVDAEDWPLVQRWSWHAHQSTGGVYPRSSAHQMLHRVLLGLEDGDSRRVDHINGDTFDNRRSNLRLATVAENAQNQGSRGGSSRYRGVTWDKSTQKWMASVMLDGRRKTLGRFVDEDEAGRVASEFRATHMPFSADARAAA